MPATRAVAYPRYSSDQQRDESIAAQMRSITEYCNTRGYVIVGTYPDEARSATTDNRPNFQKMISDSGKGMFDIVVVHKLDRFARDRYDSAFYKRILKQNGVRLESVLEQFDSSPESIILESVLEGMAEYYSKNLARESRKGMIENAMQGIHAGGRPPYGYVLNRETMRLEVDEHRAQAVRLYFEGVADGRTVNEIAQQLNDMGFRTQTGRKFTKNSFDGWARNKKYIGYYTWDCKTPKSDKGTRNNHRYRPVEEQIQIPGMVEPIIDEALFERVNEIMQNRTWTPSHYRAKAVYLLSDKVICGNCGSKMNGNGYTSKGEDYRYYTCAGKCGAKSVRKRVLEALISDTVLDECFTNEAMNHMADRIESIYQSTRMEAATVDLQPIKSEISEMDRKIDNWLEIIGMGMMDKQALVDKINEATRRKESLNAELRRLQAVNDAAKLDRVHLLEEMEKYRDKLVSMQDADRKVALQAYVSAVTVRQRDDTDKLDITLAVRVIAGGGDATPSIALTEEMALTL